MENALKAIVAVDLNLVAQNLSLTENQVRAAAELLEQGNTIPFITRYRTDATGGLEERQLLDIRNEIARMTALAERKSIILKSIENQDTLTDQLRQQIESASQARQLEELYLPYKPRKQSLAVTARQQGLEPLARDILEARTSEVDLPTRAAEFVRVDKGLSSVDEVFRGVKHLLAERFSEHQKLRRALRKMYWDQAVIEVRLAEKPAAAAAVKAVKSGPEAAASADPAAATATTPPPDRNLAPPAATVPDSASAEVAEPDSPPSDANAIQVTTTIQSPATSSEVEPASAASDESNSADSAKSSATVGGADAPPAAETPATTSTPADSPHVQSLPAKSVTARKKKKKKKKKSRPEPFAEFANFSQAIQKLPPHRILGINRGERAGQLKVRVKVDDAALFRLSREMLVPAEHPFADFLAEAAEDALQRLIVPAVEREIRRELTERAEDHAVRVFARNLRNLVLQQPVRGHRIMGIDPGYRSGCKVAVIDAQGRPVGHGVFSIVGNDERKKNNQQRLLEILNQFQPSLIAIGNGSGCHAVEQFLSEVLAGIEDGRKFQFTIVNQAGTSSYSTSEAAREELPDYDPFVRSAISIARRLQDPLSELVKVQPANIGVGMYQHDVRAKHLADILDDEVDSCVNLVGVNVNTASVSLLRHISGLGPLTARRIVEYRDAHGPFPDREALREVPGMGEVTWKQSVGFLRVADSPNLLDRTNIHPESYETVLAILQQVDGKLDDLFLPLVEPEEKTAGPLPAPAPAVPPPTTESVEAALPIEEPALPIEEPALPVEEPALPVEEAAVPVEEAAAAEGDRAAASSDPAALQTALPETGSDSTATAATSPAAAQVSEAVPNSSPSTLAAHSPAELAALRERRLELTRRLRAVDPVDMAQKLAVGEMAIRDILRALRNPHFDPRENLPAPVFRTGILKFEDLNPGMRLRGQVVNVVDFGVFINIGIGDSCLIHISRLSNRFIRDPHWHFAVADVLDVWVQDVDLAKKRVTLTAIQPESERKERTRPHRGGGKRPSGVAATAAPVEHGEARGRQRGGPRRAGDRPQRAANRTRSFERKPHKPKPVTPITEEMVKGKKPMRSFSDLLQFHQRKTTDEEPGKAE